MFDAVNRPRSRVRRWIALSALSALSLGHAPAHGETFKCINAAGKTSIQATPCQTAAEETLKFQAPAPTSTHSATDPRPATALSRGQKVRMPTEADFRGPRETWERMDQAIRRGDKDAALKELTPSAQQRLASVFDTIGSKSTPFNVEELGSVRSVMLSGEGLATITLTRKKADGSYTHQVNLIRDADGKWRIDNM